MMSPHYQPHKVSDRTEVDQSEVVLNQHSRILATILKLGSNSGSGQGRRCREALKVTDCGILPLDGMRKDHKKSEDPIGGPPLRPVCNAGIGPNAPLSNSLS